MVNEFADSTGPAGDVLCDEYVQECCKFRWFDDCNEFAQCSPIVWDGNVGTLVLPYMMEVETTNSNKTQSLVYPAERFFPLIAKDCQLSPPPLCASTQSKTTGEILGAIYEDTPKCGAFSLMPLAMVGEENWSYLFSSGGRFDCWGSDKNDEVFVKIIWGSDAR